MVEKITAVAAVGGLFFYWIRVEKPREEKKKRERQMMADYPDIISKLTILIGAGLSLPQAWMKIAADYEAKKQKTGIRWAYEEMTRTSRQIQNGAAAGRAFGEYGRRIGVHAYIKLGNLLEQNMKKGTKGLCDMLQAESYQAFEERKHQVRRMGEEASTQLLLPMFMLFFVVLIVIIVPTLLSFSI